MNLKVCVLLSVLSPLCAQAIPMDAADTIRDAVRSEMKSALSDSKAKPAKAKPVKSKATETKAATKSKAEKAKPAEVATKPKAEKSKLAEVVTKPKAEKSKPAEVVTKPKAEKSKPAKSKPSEVAVKPKPVSKDKVLLPVELTLCTTKECHQKLVANLAEKPKAPSGSGSDKPIGPIGMLESKGPSSASVSPVPVPNSLLLFGSVLAGFAWVKRKHIRR